MAKKIEILENTLLKLLVRRGSDIDRKNVALSEGELGYTTDNKRLFVGDGQTVGGIITGNKYKGSKVDHTTVTDALEGDYVYNSTEKSLYIKTATDWLKTARAMEAADGSIVIDDASGTVKVGTLSANNFNTDAFGNSLEIDADGRVAVKNSITVNQVSANTSTYLSLPQKLSINSIDYDWPDGGALSNTFLSTDVNGNLSWRVPQESGTFFFNSTAGPLPVGTITPYVSATDAPPGYLLCNGQAVSRTDFSDLFKVISTEYGAGDGSTTFNIPDFRNSALYGVESDPAGSTTYDITTTGTSALSAKGAIFIIKAIPDELVQSTIKVEAPLTLEVNGLATSDSVSPLSGNIVIKNPIPGVEVFETAGSGTFVTQATYTKFWITGSGSKGYAGTGGAAATVYGILSAPIGSPVVYTVAAGTTVAGDPGSLSKISVNAVDLAISDGALYAGQGVPDTEVNSGTLNLASNYVLAGHIIPGGSGGLDVSSGDEEASGTSSFWGSGYVAGAGPSQVAAIAHDSADGLVKFEWGI